LNTPRIHTFNLLLKSTSSEKKVWPNIKYGFIPANFGFGVGTSINRQIGISALRFVN